MEITPEQLEACSPFIFIKNRNIKNEQGLPLNFKDRAFMLDILRDMSPYQAILKAPQIGATVLETIKSFWVAKYLKKDIIYTLPTAADVTDMAGGKINRIVAQNPIFLDWIKEHDTVEQKNVGDNIIYYRGTFSSKQAMMVSSQLNIHDEIDASNPEVITQYETRQQAQAGGWRWYFSHPSLVGAGIDKYWQKSDQKEWFIKCGACNKEQFLEWPLNIDQERECYQCKFCSAELTDDMRRNGKWKKLYPDAEFSGYHIPQLICPWIPASKIIKDFKEKDSQYFHNFVLALPYADTQSKVNLETIKELLTDYRQPKGRVIFGVDTGVKIRYVIGDMNGLFDIGEVDNYQELQRVCNKYKDWIMVMDRGGDIIGPTQFQEANQGKVFLCTFNQDTKSMKLVKWGEGDEYGRVLADRNRSIQLVVDEINDKRIPLYGNLEKWWNLWLHFSHIFRTVEEDRMGNLMYAWQRSDRDDWVLAMVYWRMGIERFGQNESYFTGDGYLNRINEAPYRDIKGNMPAPLIILPDTNKQDDWRTNGD